MNQMNKFFLTTLIMAGIVTGVQAQETANATVTATIVTPISIQKDVDMNFGNVAVRTSAGGTVVLTPAGVRSRTNGVTLPTTDAGTVTAASFTVAGTEDYTYAITLPSAPHQITFNTTNHMNVTLFNSTPSLAGLLTGGEQILNVGATLTVGAAQPAGIYVSDAPFDVTVNYN